MKIWFMGSGSFAASCLCHIAQDLDIETVITGLPTLSGRGLSEQPSLVEGKAISLGLPVLRTGRLSENEHLLQLMQTSPPDLILVIDFSQLIREPFLNGPRLGCLNVHPSLLPRWRGAAPIQRALMNGDCETGVTVFRLVSEMDAGPILGQARIAVDLSMGAVELFDILALMGSQIAVRGVKSLIEGSCQFSDQNSEYITHAGKISKYEAHLSWNQNNLVIHNTVRALNSSIGTFIIVKEKRLKLWRTFPVAGEGKAGEIIDFIDSEPVVACAEGALRLSEVQMEGKRRVSAAEWIKSSRLTIGEVLV